MNVSVSNRQSGLGVSLSRVADLAGFLLRRASRSMPPAGLSGLSLTIEDDEGIRAVNRSFLGHDETTDVISFRYDALPGEAVSGPIGDVMVNARRALAVGSRFGGVAAELALYIAHGIDHLTGADDRTTTERRRMRRRELRWLREAGRAGLLRGLVQGPGRARRSHRSDTRPT